VNDLKIHTIDLDFLGRKGTIAAYLVPHAVGCILVETGPESTIDTLTTRMKELGFGISDVTDIFLTHIHLDHAGSAGWWARHGATIHVHEVGAPHLINPEKLLASAGRLYGDKMDFLWGEFLPVPEDKLSIMHDHETYAVGGLSVLALDVPGHASHHLAYFIEGACFSGDIGGIRLSPQHYVRLPMPPPDLNLDQWRKSIRRIQQQHPNKIVPTHFGVYSDADWHLQAVLDELDAVENWMERILPYNPAIAAFRQQFADFERTRAIHAGVTSDMVESQQIANPSSMSADGIYRYWKKFRQPENPK
jgi:glyoxylase-like metal-dependent hydrolase (beta-lactamase superfamily II)